MTRVLCRTEVEIALRVLSAITQRRSPDPEDAEQLRRLLPCHEWLAAEELARDAAMQANGEPAATGRLV